MMQAEKTAVTRELVARVEGFSSLSVILPCYRLGSVLKENLRRVESFLCGIPHELIPVDDGSDDDTAAVLRSIAAAPFANIRPVILPTNCGKGAALRAGFQASHGSHILLLDGDLDLNPAFIASFLQIAADSRAAVVIGSKLHPDSIIEYPFRRRVASAVYYGLVKLLLGLPIHDTQTGMKLFTREALGYALDRMLAKRYAFDLEVLAILHEAGYEIAEAPIELNFGKKAGALTVRNTSQVLQDTLAIFYRCRILHYYRSLEPHPPPAVPPRVSVVIACPGDSALLRECIEGLSKQTGAELEVLILPDVPTNIEWPPFVREYPTGKVRPSEKRNLGIRQSTGSVVAFLDDDAVPLPGWLSHAIAYFSDPDIGGVGGPAVTPAGESYLATLSGLVYQNPLVSGRFRRRYTPTRVCEEDDLPSCNLFVRRDLLLQLGLFDTAFWPGEDTLLCRAITRDAGKRILYDPAVLVAHHRRPLFGPHLRQVGRYARHRGFFARRFPENSRRIAYFLPSLFVLGALGTALLALLRLFLSEPSTVARLCRGLDRIGIAVLICYAVATFLASVRPLHPLSWLLVWLGVMATHVQYGIRFLQGFLFGVPQHGTVKAFDHQGNARAEKPLR